MTKPRILVAMLVLYAFAPACGDDDDGAPAGADAALVDGGAPDAPPSTMPDASYTYDQNGCLTFASASDVCGFASDGTVCTLARTCGQDPDDGQCKINCEMGTTVSCYKMADVDCLLAATAASDCAALAACGWIL
jgi:hypothetical protein